MSVTARTAARTFAYAPLPYDAVIPAMLSSVVAEHGAADLVVTCLGDGSLERITYAQADSESSMMAAQLLNAGVTKGVRVGILAPNGPEFVVAFLAATRIGAVAVPLNTFLQPAELAWVLRDADVAIVIGANPVENHPVAATFFKQFTKRGGKLIVMDPRGVGLKRHASHRLQFRPGTDVSMLNAIMHVIVEEELYDRQYIEAFTENWDAEKAHLANFPPEKMAEVCGIEADVLRDVARTFAGAKAAMIFWGMGISQHIHGTDNSRIQPITYFAQR